MAQNAEAWLRRRGDEALRRLWKMLGEEGITAAQRIGILQFFAEMAFGKPRTMDVKMTDGPGGFGVILMPAEDPIDKPPYMDLTL